MAGAGGPGPHTRKQGLMGARRFSNLLLPAALALLLLLCLAPPATGLSLPFLKQKPPPEDDLIAWVRSQGGNVSVRVGLVPGRGGLRGMMAAHAVPRGQPLVVLPSNLSVPMGTAEYTTPVRKKVWLMAEEIEIEIALLSLLSRRTGGAVPLLIWSASHTAVCLPAGRPAPAHTNHAPKVLHMPLTTL